MKKKYLLLFVLLIFATMINSGCSKSRKEIVSNKAVVEPVNTKWGETCRVYFKPTVPCDSVWFVTLLYFSDSLENTIYTMTKGEDYFYGEFTVPEKLLSGYVQIRPISPIPEMQINDNIAPLTVLDGNGLEVPSALEIFNFPSTERKKYLRDCNIYFYKILAWDAISTIKDSEQLIEFISELGEEPQSSEILMSISIIYAALDSFNTAIDIAQRIPPGPTKIDEVALATVLDRLQWSSQKDSVFHRKVLEFAAEKFRENSNMYLGILPVMLRRNDLITTEELSEYARKSWRRLDKENPNVQLLQSVWMSAKYSNDTAIIEEIMPFTIDLIERNQHRKLTSHTKPFADDIITSINLLENKLEPETVIELCNLAFSEISEVSRTDIYRSFFTWKRAEAYFKLGDITNAEKDALTFHVITNDSISKKFIEKITGLPVEQAVSMLKDKYPKICPSLPDSFTLITLDGREIGPDQLKGSIIVICFWGSECKKCIEQFSLLNQIANWANKYGVSCYAITKGKDSKGKIQKIAESTNLRYKICWDKDDCLFKHFDISKVPQHVIINQNGEVVRIIPALLRDPSDVINTLMNILKYASNE